MDIREIEALKHLANYCLDLYNLRSGKTKKWPYDGLNGPTEFEAQIMMEAYVSGIDAEERKNNPNFANPYTPEYALEVVRLIQVFLALHENHPEQIDETQPDPNIIGPSVMIAYEGHLEDLERQKKERVGGRKIKIPSLGEQIERQKEIYLEEVRQKAFLGEIDNHQREVLNELKDVIEKSLEDPSFLL